MKSWLLTSLFVTASFSLQAGVVKSCKTVMELDNSKVPTEITITQKGESLKSIMKQTVDGQVSELQDTVTV
jgi:carbon monoxide dehydrogenase subunit G